MKQSSLKWNFIYNICYQILQICIPLVTTPYLSRVLGAENIGEYSYAYNIAHYFVLFAMLGIANYGKRTIAMVRDDYKRLSVTFSSLYAMQLITSIFVVVVYVGYLCICGNTLMYVMLFYVLSAALDINWFFFGMEQFKITITRNVIVKVCTTAAIFLFVHKEEDIYLYALIMTSSMLVSQIVVWPFLRGQVQFVKVKLSDVKEHVSHNLFFFITVISVSIYKSMDKIMLGAMSSTEQLGFYESSEKIVVIPIAIVTALGTVMLPRISNLVSHGKKEQIHQYIHKSILFSMFLSSSISFGIMGVSQEFVPLFYGDGFEECIALFQILLPSGIFIAFANVLMTQHILPNKKEYIQIQAVVLGAVLNFVLNLLLIQLYHARGVALGTLLTEFVVCAYQAFRVRKELPIKKYLLESVPFVLTGILMYVILVHMPQFMDSLVLFLCVKILIGICIYIIIIAIWLFAIKRKCSEFIRRR